MRNQASTQTPELPAAPAAPQPGAVVAPSGLPRSLTGAELTAIREQRSELSDQLVSASNRREDLARELRGTTGADRAGLEQRIVVLDERIVQLESDMAETGRQLTAAPHLTSSTQAGPMLEGLNSGQVTGISIVFILFVLAPLAIALARLMFRRASRPRPMPALAEAGHRIEQLQQSVDAIAIEVERISEGQRFVTRILAEGDSARQAAIARPAGEAMRVARD